MSTTSAIPTHPTVAQLLAELQPLAAVIADKVHTVPVRLGPRGAEDLINELTLAVAVFCGRHVLPADAVALANPPRPAELAWCVEAQDSVSGWGRYSSWRGDREGALEEYEDVVGRRGDRHSYRLLRASANYVVEAEHRAPAP